MLRNVNLTLQVNNARRACLKLYKIKQLLSANTPPTHEIASLIQNVLLRKVDRSIKGAQPSKWKDLSFGLLIMVVRTNEVATVCTNEHLKISRRLPRGPDLK